jgi:hypothetical protein
MNQYFQKPQWCSFRYGEEQAWQLSRGANYAAICQVVHYMGIKIYLPFSYYPASASLAQSLAQQTSVTKDGITWTFDRPVPVGQFINGDYYVIGPLAVTAIDPSPTTRS